MSSLCSDHEDIGGDSGITDENKAILERVRLSTRRDYLQGAASGSVRATDRLMRELQDIYRSQNFKDGACCTDSSLLSDVCGGSRSVLHPQGSTLWS